jgi:hypothetical protein
MGHCVCVHFYYIDFVAARVYSTATIINVCVVAAEMRIKIVSNDFSRFDRIYIYGGGRVGTSKSSRLMQ